MVTKTTSSYPRLDPAGLCTTARKIATQQQLITKQEKTYLTNRCAERVLHISGQKTQFLGRNLSYSFLVPYEDHSDSTVADRKRKKTQRRFVFRF